MRIAVAADHNGLDLKARLTDWLEAHGHTVTGHGAHPGTGEVDYPPLCVAVCRQVVQGEAERGLVLGGSGLGETIACNKVRGIRAGLCHDEWSARISRGNNDANVLVLAAKVLPPATAELVLATWLDTPFKGGVHQRRVDQITALDGSRRWVPWPARRI